MKIVGVIAEYNPFHNGHAYHLREARERANADYLIVVMSGDFTQRGAPAILDKYERARMALHCGADLVLELPALWATASAEYFAQGGIALLEKLGCVDAVCFGCETPDANALVSVARLLCEEPATYREALDAALRSGMSFPAARERAVLASLPGLSLAGDHAGITTPSLDGRATPSVATSQAGHAGRAASSAVSPQAAHAKPSASSPQAAHAKPSASSPQATDAKPSETLSPASPATVSRILSSPNNILALEYCKAILCRRSPLTPILVQRVGQGYHDLALHPDSDFASASGIRAYLRDVASRRPGRAPSPLRACMPEASYGILCQTLRARPLIFPEDFSAMLGYCLLLPDSFEDYADSSKDLSNRILSLRYNYRAIPDFLDALKTKDVTYARLSRLLTHILLHMQKKDYEQYRSLDYALYGRILGFREEAAPLRKALRANSGIPLLADPTDKKRLLSEDARGLLQKDFFASSVYRLGQMQKSGLSIPDERQRPFLKI